MSMQLHPSAPAKPTPPPTFAPTHTHTTHTHTHTHTHAPRSYSALVMAAHKHLQWTTEYVKRHKLEDWTREAQVRRGVRVRGAGPPPGTCINRNSRPFAPTAPQHHNSWSHYGNSCSAAPSGPVRRLLVIAVRVVLLLLLLLLCLARGYHCSHTHTHTRTQAAEELSELLVEQMRLRAMAAAQAANRKGK